MIADTGTREELRAWWFSACSVPLPGEVYRVHPLGSGYRFCDIWHVKKVRKHKVPPSVVVDVYIVNATSVSHGKNHKNVEMALSEWQNMYDQNQVHYQGINLEEAINHAWWLA